MSREGVEKALYDLGVSKRSRGAFGADPGDFVARYVLTSPQQQMLVARDVAGLLRLGANPMLVWGFWMTCSDDRSNRTYLERVRAQPVVIDDERQVP